LTAIGQGSGEALGDIWDAVKGLPGGIVHSLPPVQFHDSIKQAVPVFQAYEQARSSGKSVWDSMRQANEVAKQHDAAQQALQARIDEFKKKPGAASVRGIADAAAFAATIFDGGALNPANTELPAGVSEANAAARASAGEGAVAAKPVPSVAETEAAASPVESAVAKAAAKSKLPEGQPASVAPTGEDIQPTLQQGIRDTMGKVADENGVAKSTAKSIRDVVKETADNVYAKSKSQFGVLDEATGGNVSRFDEQIRNVNRALANVTDDVEEGKLLARKANLEASQEEAFEQARAKGVDPNLVDEAKANYKKAQSLYDVDNHVKMSTSGTRPGIGKLGAQMPEVIDPKKLSSRLNKVYDSGRLQDAVGDDNAQALLEHSDNAQIAGQQIKEFVPSSPTGQKAMQDILKPNTKGNLIGKGANTDFLKSYRDFDALAPEEQAARFGKDVGQARDYLQVQARNQIIKKWGGRVGLGAIAHATGVDKAVLHAIWD